MPEHRYELVDVFTDRAFGGNPLAVFPDGRGLTDAAMQAIARELNLSETTFVLPPADPANDFRVRIFTPAEELPMAGHPTLGTAFVLAQAGRIALAQGRGSARFEEGVGVIPVTLEPAGGGLTLVTMEQRPPVFGLDWEDRKGVAEALSADEWMLHPSYPVQAVSCGIPFLIVPVRDLEAIRRLSPRRDLWAARLGPAGSLLAMAFTLQTSRPGITAHCRMFAPTLGVAEDPATGAAAGPLGCYFVHHAILPRPEDPAPEFRFEQGLELGRPSLLRATIRRQGARIDGVLVAGTCVPVGTGVLHAVPRPQPTHTALRR